MGFVFYLFISNVIQILLMPLIMVGQNIQGAHAEGAPPNTDLDVNIKGRERDRGHPRATWNTRTPCSCR